MNDSNTEMQIPDERKLAKSALRPATNGTLRAIRCTLTLLAVSLPSALGQDPATPSPFSFQDMTFDPSGIMRVKLGFDMAGEMGLVDPGIMHFTQQQLSGGLYFSFNTAP